ncbi:hypothetical protein [Bacteroides sp. 519]|nr:hypothetical protein [Bacteroides sp. 519]
MYYILLSLWADAADAEKTKSKKKAKTPGVKKQSKSKLSTEKDVPL